uniref:RNase H domain-containing protein n=1 Tax=Macrostomum lignano TaxID=282301 RepID=A0A1I8HPB9_9PLAT
TYARKRLKRNRVEPDAFKGEVVWSYSQHTGLNSSVFQSEVLAISSCAAELRRRQLSGRKFIFHSDSQAALRALCRSTASSRSVLDCNTQLNGLALGNQVELRWIPGHAGFLGNERADLLAKAGSAGALLGPGPGAPIPASVINSRVKRWADSEHLRRLNRRDLRAVSMALSGHGCFSRHRFLQGQVPEERCPFCRSGSENAEHFICHCPVFTRARLTHLGPNPVLSDVCRPESIPLLARYLRDTGRADFFPTVGEEDRAAGETDGRWSPGASGMGGLLRLLAASAGRPLQLSQKKPIEEKADAAAANAKRQPQIFILKRAQSEPRLSVHLCDKGLQMLDCGRQLCRWRDVRLQPIDDPKSAKGEADAQRNSVCDSPPCGSGLAEFCASSSRKLGFCAAARAPNRSKSHLRAARRAAAGQPTALPRGAAAATAADAADSTAGCPLIRQAADAAALPRHRRIGDAASAATGASAAASERRLPAKQHLAEAAAPRVQRLAVDPDDQAGRRGPALGAAVGAEVQPQPGGLGAVRLGQHGPQAGSPAGPLRQLKAADSTHRVGKTNKKENRLIFVISFSSRRKPRLPLHLRLSRTVTEEQRPQVRKPRPSSKAPAHGPMTKATRLKGCEPSTTHRWVSSSASMRCSTSSSTLSSRGRPQAARCIHTDLADRASCAHFLTAHRYQQIVRASHHSRPASQLLYSRRKHRGAPLAGVLADQVPVSAVQAVATAGQVGAQEGPQQTATHTMGRSGNLKRSLSSRKVATAMPVQARQRLAHSVIHTEASCLSSAENSRLAWHRGAQELLGSWPSRTSAAEHCLAPEGDSAPLRFFGGGCCGGGGGGGGRGRFGRSSMPTWWTPNGYLRCFKLSSSALNSSCFGTRQRCLDLLDGSGSQARRPRILKQNSRHGRTNRCCCSLQNGRCMEQTNKRRKGAQRALISSLNWCSRVATSFCVPRAKWSDVLL